MTTKLILAALALTIGSVVSSASFAQSGTITFTGRILAPACTGSITPNTTHPNTTLADISLGQCAANSNAQVVRTSINTTNANSTTAQHHNSVIVTVTYE